MFLFKREDKFLRRARKQADRVVALKGEFEGLTDEALQAKTAEFRARVQAGESLDDLLPEVFAQVRVGKNGRQFKFYKFRSMNVNAEEQKKELMAQNEMDGHMFKMANDPRIFPIGKFMRKYSIDELPQFWNILKGDMSLVGTRPPTVEEFENYDLKHKARLGIKPGLTGMWQVSGRSDIKDFEEVVGLDTYYIAHWDLGLDIKILLKTIKVVVTGRGSE